MGGAVYTPKQQNWRWYTDATPDTSMSALANENAKPTLADSLNIIRLRVTVAETGGKADNAVTIAIQYDTDSGFSSPQSLGAAPQHWNYANGAGTEGSAVDTQLLTDATTKNEYCESGTNVVAIALSSANEIDIAIVPTASVSNSTTYYFRIVGDGTAIPLNTGETYPQVLTAAAAYTISIQSGAFTVTGTTVAPKTARKIAMASGVYVLTGTHVDLTVGSALNHYTLPIASGAFALTGTSTALKTARKIVVASGAFSLTGTPVGLKSARRLSLASGTYLLTGTATALKVARKLTISSGEYTLTGTSVGLEKLAIAASNGTLHLLRGSRLVQGLQFWRGQSRWRSF